MMMMGDDGGDDDVAMEIQLLLTGPTDEEDFDKCLGGTAGVQNSHQMPGHRLDDSLSGDGPTSAEQNSTDHRMEADYLEPSMLGSFSSPWSCGRRGTRIRKRSWRVQVSHLFGSQYPFKNRGLKRRSRKNNEHWSEDEMIELVDGVSRRGVGKWSKLKGDRYFSRSIRTAANLKDKWRNLVRACRAKSTHKKKVQVMEATESIVQRFRHRILAIEGKHLARKKKWI